ncbi:fructoselysine 3-epimerase [Pseudobythopirellula maris]|uniref:Fructoselysine 3-epimerase n=1 Tax=Pseudobythopirellula maris TaxID=2527991 RepID=A0A5C5ZKB8_9BACT|nr:sugar phosphate isomerase/epimerase family protein [Pseudobythopirellula maris]TWT87578.1 fructoselysine 3-epimerase [Pseudobythopirellula maris]
MNQTTTFRWSFDEDLHYYRLHGFKGIGVWRRKLLDFGVERGVELLGESGLSVSNLTWAGGFTGIDGLSLAESIADAHEAIRLAKRIHAGRLVVYPGGRNGHTLRHARRLLIEALGELTPLAETLGVTLAIEPMNPCCAQEWSFLTCLDETLDLIAEIGSDQLRVVYDTYHFPIDACPIARLADLAPKIAIVRLSDTASPHTIDQERCPLGEGHTPLGEIVVALREAGYDGWYDVQLSGPVIESAPYEELLAGSRRAFDALAIPTASAS